MKPGASNQNPHLSSKQEVLSESNGEYSEEQFQDLPNSHNRQEFELEKEYKTETEIEDSNDLDDPRRKSNFEVVKGASALNSSEDQPPQEKQDIVEVMRFDQAPSSSEGSYRQDNTRGVATPIKESEIESDHSPERQKSRLQAPKQEWELDDPISRSESESSKPKFINSSMQSSSSEKLETRQELRQSIQEQDGLSSRKAMDSARKEEESEYSEQPEEQEEEAPKHQNILNGDLLSESSEDDLNKAQEQQFVDMEEGEDSSLPDPEELENRRKEIKGMSDLDKSEDLQEQEYDYQIDASSKPVSEKQGTTPLASSQRYSGVDDSDSSLPDPEELEKKAKKTSEKYSDIESESSGKPNIVNESLNEESDSDETDKKAFDYKLTKSLSDLDGDSEQSSKKSPEKKKSSIKDDSEDVSDYNDEDFEDEKELGIQIIEDDDSDTDFDDQFIEAQDLREEKSGLVGDRTQSTKNKYEVQRAKSSDDSDSYDDEFQEEIIEEKSEKYSESFGEVKEESVEDVKSVKKESEK